MLNRLPELPRCSIAGYVYVLQDGPRFKLGFSRTRHGVDRRSRDFHAPAIIVIPTRHQPAQLEYLINSHFLAKRLPPQGNRPGDKREWFAFDDGDLAWLHGLADVV